MIFLSLLATVLSFYDAHLEKLWSQIEDINKPTLEEYLLIEDYLASKNRPYLDELWNSSELDTYKGRLDRILDFKLVTPTLAMPTTEMYSFHIDEYSNRKCIVLFSSSNGIYPEKAKKLLSEIENSGYSGHVLMQVGGFPNRANGGLKLCHIPYAFKVAALMDAKERGFTEILWLDLAIHPLKDFETIFWEIEQNGYFFTTVGSLNDNKSTHLKTAAAALDIGFELYGKIPHISSSIIGLNMENERARALMENWYDEVVKVTPCITWWPEELSLSVVAWRLNLKPSLSFGNFVCTEGERFQLESRPSVQFYLDAVR